METQEQQLIRSAQAGNTYAFDQLVKLHDRRILQIALAIVGNLLDAQEVYQETFVRAFSKIATFRFESEFGTWLARIAVNYAISFRKRTRLRKFWGGNPVPDQELDSNVLLHDDETPEQLFLTGEFHRQIRQGLTRLSGQQCAVFVMKHFQGIKIREIAEVLGCTEGSVKNQLFRATQKLQSFLRPYIEGKK